MQLFKSAIIVLLGLCACSGQRVENDEGNDQSSVSARRSQDVSILKQIHRHNEDGSYTYGFEGSDGSFKIETKSRAGEVSGKYGYVDDAGKLRVVEYGANKHGFQPSGEGITVPAPTLVQLNEEPYDDEPVRPTAAKKPKTAKPQKPLFRGDVGSPDFGGAPVEPTGSELGNEAAWTVPSADELRNSFRLDASDDRPQAVVAKAPAPPANAHRVATDSARSGAARHKSLAPRPQQTVTAFAPEEPLPVSGSFRSVQDFDGRRSQVALSRSYQTSERVDDDEIPPRFQPAAAPSRRHPAAARPSQPDDKRLAASRQVRPGVLDQLVEQYALPESGSPATHSVSFGLDS